MQYTVAKYSHHAVHYIPGLTYFITESLYILAFSHLAHSPTPYLWQPPICPLYV